MSVVPCCQGSLFLRSEREGGREWWCEKTPPLCASPLWCAAVPDKILRLARKRFPVVPPAQVVPCFVAVVCETDGPQTKLGSVSSRCCSGLLPPAWTTPRTSFTCSNQSLVCGSFLSGTSTVDCTMKDQRSDKMPENHSISGVKMATRLRTDTSS